LQAAKVRHRLWMIPGCPYRITIPATALREINQIVVESYYAVPRGGVEIGGVFFGVTAGESLHILAYRPVHCQYLTGPSFNLSVDDKARLSRVLALPESDPKLAKLSVLGWYHSHHRSEIFLSKEDLELYNEFFPGAQQIALVLRPAHMKATRAGFFFRDAEGRIQADAPLQEFIVDPPGSELTLLDHEGQSALEQSLDEQGVRPRAGDGDALPAAAEPEAPAPEPNPEPPAPQASRSIGIASSLHDVGPAGSTAPLTTGPSGIRLDPPRCMTSAEPAFQLDLAPTEIAETVEDAEAPTPLTVPIKEESVENTTSGGRWLRALHDLILGSERSERRSANRTAGTGLAVFFWEGDVPKARTVRDISRRGLFVESEFLWAPGTRIVLTLQIGGKSPQGKSPTDTIAITTEVVRSAPGGMGLRFLFPRVEDMRVFLRFLLRWKPDFKS